jgi:HK97 family phage portal protein
MPEWDLSTETPTPRTPERRWSLQDPATAVLLGGTPNYSGEAVGENSALTLSAVYRALSLISQTGASLPLKTYRELDDDSRIREKSFLDNPAGPTSLLTPFEWKEQVFLHLLVRGESDLLHVRNEAGALIGTIPVHPAAVAVYRDENADGGERYTVSLDDGENLSLTPFGRTKDDPGMTRIVGPRTRGLRGWSPLTLGATALGIGLAAERATARMFREGALIQGVLTPAMGEVIDDQDANAIRKDLDRHAFGNSNAGTVPLINRVLQFNSWQMTNVDAQFMENRVFQIEEISRFFGVPPHLLMSIEKTTSWGTGIAEQNKNLAQYVLTPWCKRIEERVSRLLPQPRWVEFDMAGLLAGSAQEESSLLLSEVNGGLRTLNEARRIKNLPPLPGGDALRIPSGVMLQDQLEASAALTAAQADTAGPTDSTAGGTDGTP